VLLLVQRLWQSLEGQLSEDDDLFAEIERRDSDMENGAVKTYSHDEYGANYRRPSPPPAPEIGDAAEISVFRGDWRSPYGETSIFASTTFAIRADVSCR
jgi:hypothetical protein